MRRKAALFCVIVTLAFVSPAFAATYYNYDQYGGTWSDANKNWVGDTLLCWAAAASNALTWTAWNASYPSAVNKFSYFKNEWTNVGGLPKYGWRWWFDGTNPMQGMPGWSQLINPGSSGNFYSTAQYNSAFHELDVWGSSDKRQSLPTIETYLKSGYGVNLGIYGPSGHAITIWGYEYDDTKTDLSKYLGLWITDSDDNVTALRYYDVELIGNIWYFENLYGYRNEYWIGIVEGLDRNLQGVPEPGTMLLLVIGLAGISGFARKRLFKA